MGVQDRALMAPPEFAQTEAAIAQAERSPGAKQCPDKIAKAKELAKQGIETYWACRTEDALKMLAEARRLAKEAEGCQPPPAPAPKPTPPPPPAPPKKEISFKWVYFDFDKFVLTPQARGILDETARILQANPEVKLELAGHTDGRGTDGYNRRLSEKRSKAVYDYLITRGIAPGRLKPTAFGEANPVASNETEEGRAKNRRVELKILR
jgi:outer membrane protein OmpA-like peptidoglycan-associated protein